MMDHSAPADLSALREELKAFAERWEVVVMPYDPSATAIPESVWVPGETALRQAGRDPVTVSEVEQAAFHAPAIREWMKQVIHPSWSKWVDRLDDLTLWRRAHVTQDQRFDDHGEAVQGMVTEKAVALFLHDFAPLADRIVNALGRRRWPDEPPNPPEVPEWIRPDDLAADLFGIESNNSHEAGKLCLLWGAMANNPRAFHRPLGWPRKVELWARQLVVPIEQGNGYRTLRQPIQWARDAFEHLAAEQPTTKSDAAKVQNRAPLGVTRIGYLGGTDLADALGVHASRRDAFFRQLERKRTSLGDDSWQEVYDPRPNSPRFQYRVDSAQLVQLAAAYQNPKLD